MPCKSVPVVLPAAPTDEVRGLIAGIIDYVRAAPAKLKALVDGVAFEDAHVGLSERGKEYGSDLDVWPLQYRQQGDQVPAWFVDEFTDDILGLARDGAAELASQNTQLSFDYEPSTQYAQGLLPWFTQYMRAADARIGFAPSWTGLYQGWQSPVPPAGVFDTLLWNEQGHLTEFTRGNLVVELDGRCLTPPRADGLLPGVLRAELLARGELVEASITAADLARATGLWFINSLRGRLPVRLAAVGGDATA